MTIQNTTLSAEYLGLLSDGHATGRAADIAHATEKAIDAMLEILRDAGFSIRSDDDAFHNLEIELYRIVKHAHTRAA